MCSFAETTHTPQGDGNLYGARTCRFTRRKQPTPRKGTETAFEFVEVITIGNNPHPARGRKHFSYSSLLRPARNNPHPARGRKPAVHEPLLCVFETTHTPQGDGNPQDPISRHTRRRNDPHPARGRKPGCDSVLVDVRRNNPHPARGRKLVNVFYCPRHWETTHTPQGDGNITRSHSFASL